MRIRPRSQRRQLTAAYRRQQKGSVKQQEQKALAGKMLEIVSRIDEEQRIEHGSYKLPNPWLKSLRSKQGRFWLFKSGRGSGKTFAICAELLRLSFLDDFKGAVILCLREVQKSIDDSTKAVLAGLIADCKVYRKYFTVDKTKIVNKVTGCRFLFLGMSSNAGASQHNTRDKIRSTYNIKAVFGDEAQAFADESLEVLFPTADRQAKIAQIATLKSAIDDRLIPAKIEADCRFYFAMNPRLGEADPVHQRIKSFQDHYGKEVAHIVHANIDQIDEFAQSKTLLEQMEADRKRGLPNFGHVWKGEPLASLGAAIFYKLEDFTYDSLEGFRDECGRGHEFYAFIDPATTYNNDATAITCIALGGVSYDRWGNIEEGSIAIWGKSWQKPFKDCLKDIRELLDVSVGALEIPVYVGVEDNAIKDASDYLDGIGYSAQSYHTIGKAGSTKFDKIETVGIAITHGGEDLETFIVREINEDGEKFELSNRHYIDGLRNYMPRQGLDDQADSLSMCGIHSGLWREPNLKDHWTEAGSYLRKTLRW